MKTIKIIDLLNKIANGEAPKRIKTMGNEWAYEKDDYWSDYEGWFSTEYLELSVLNDEVEILDEEDEFEDIEGLNIFTDPNTIDNSEFVWRINYLIKNQKKIIERLKDE
jgi:hypothetical protein